MLEELEYELDFLRDQKRKDQLVIADIQRKIDGISFTGRPRPLSRQPFPEDPFLSQPLESFGPLRDYR